MPTADFAVARWWDGDKWYVGPEDVNDPSVFVQDCDEAEARRAAKAINDHASKVVTVNAELANGSVLLADHIAAVQAAVLKEREDACSMILAWADAEDRMAEECKRRGFSDAATTRFRVRNMLKQAADRVRTGQPAPDRGLYEDISAAIRKGEPQ